MDRAKEINDKFKNLPRGFGKAWSEEQYKQSKEAEKKKKADSNKNKNSR